MPLTAAVARSSFYETEAVDVPREFADLVFTNTAMAVETGLGARDFSDAVHGIETALGRTRSGLRHEPRTIDIDIVSFGDMQSGDPALTLPHPEAVRRRFVMEPIAEMLPGFVLPGQKRTAAEIAAALPAEPRVTRLDLARRA